MENLFKELATRLPASRLEDDVRDLLAEADWQLEVDGVSLKIEREVPIQVVARGLHAYELTMGFGDHYRVMVSIGEANCEGGIVEAEVCFATLWYSGNMELLTVDFSLKMP